MKYLILKIPSESIGKSYRGTYRSSLEYDHDLDETHEKNRAFLNYLENSDETRVIESLRSAQQIAEKFNDLSLAEQYEIVLVTKGNSGNNDFERLIGYDVSNAYFFSLVDFLSEHDLYSKENAPRDSDYWKMVPLIELLQKYFEHLLNVNGLFKKYSDAEYFLSCVEALRSFIPNLWENKEIKFEVLGLWEVE